MKRESRQKEMPRNLKLNLDFGKYKKLTNAADYNRLAEQTLAAVKHGLKKPVIINILFTGDKEIREFNKNYRGKDKPTNVLSFANIDDENFAQNLKLFPEIELGDIIVSVETMEKEAKEKNISAAHHLSHLLVHSFLHLLGFDHQNDNEASAMENLEIKILKKLGINNPYEE